jgi:hypothetical protein
MHAFQIGCWCAGAVFVYLYLRWWSSTPLVVSSSRESWRDTKAILLVAVAWVLLLVLPWSLYLGWTLSQIIAADVPIRRMRTVIYLAYALVSLGVFLIVQSTVMQWRERARLSTNR